MYRTQMSNLSLSRHESVIQQFQTPSFLGHLSLSGDLLLSVGIRRDPSITTWPVLNQFRVLHVKSKDTKNYKLHNSPS